MDYQILNKKFKFNKDKNIGSVLYIVEGERREINLLGYIFKEILKYDEVIGIDRSGNERIKYISKENKNSKVFIINSEQSNIQSIANTHFRDEQVKKLKQYDDEFNYENIPIFYIFDCDRKNDKKAIENIIKTYINAREPSEENKYDSIGGMVLLSYPAIESFVISNFEKDMYKFHEKFDFSEKNLKQYIGENKYDNHKMSIDTLSNAFLELINSLQKIDVNKINLDNTKEFNTDIFNYEQSVSNQYMLSLLLISFVDLGIIEIE